MNTKINTDLSKINKVQLGCGKDHYRVEDGWANLDISDFCNPEIQHDIRLGLPMFADNSLDAVTANGILEMILPNEEFLFVLNDIWRVLKPDGKCSGQVPSTDPRVLMYDPFDRRWFQEATFRYWKDGAHEWKEFGTQYKFKPWDIYYLKTNDNGIICFEMSPAQK